MKSFVVALAFIAVASAATTEIPILRQDADVSFDGSYYSSFETGNGIQAEERGVLKNPGVKDAEAEEVVGSFSYTAPDGTPIQLRYVANEDGFVAEGAHLPVAPVDTNVAPTPPPIPAAIARALEWIAAHPQKEEPLRKVVALAFIAVASAATTEIPILRQDADVSFDGSYYSSFETGNGIQAEERGVLKNPGVKDAEAEEVVGSFSYTAPDGTPIQLRYVANGNGYVAEGAHLPVAPVDTNVAPTPPPIPAAIARALEWIAAHPQKEEPSRKV